MFYFLHRAVKVAAALLIGGILGWAWTQRSALEPAYVWHDVYQNGGIGNTQQLAVVHGRGVHVLDGHSFHLRSGKDLLSVRLIGLELPVPPLDPEGLQLELRRREVLRRSVLSNEVSVAITYSNNFSVLGIAYSGGTNLNLLYVTNGLGKFVPQFVKGAPREVQYKFFAASRWREKMLKRHGSGIAATLP